MNYLYFYQQVLLRFYEGYKASLFKNHALWVALVRVFQGILHQCFQEQSLQARMLFFYEEVMTKIVISD